jgi:hypothetical protein
MEFTLHYRGELKANRGAKDKHALRRHFHSQLSILWEQAPLSGRKDLLGLEKQCPESSILQTVGGFEFAPLVNEKLNLIAELNITMLRPEPPGAIITQSGDIDNRLKTLFDALKMPKEPTALPREAMPQEGESPFFCLLEDDNLITKISVSTDRLLYGGLNSSEVELQVHVTIKALRASYANIGLG